jgi:hypothetical protein
VVDEFAVSVLGSVAGVAGVVVGIVFGVIPFVRRRKTTTDAAPKLELPAEPANALLPADRKSYLSRGQSLLAGQSLYSPDGRTRFTLQDNANMVVFVDGIGDICDTGTTNLGKPKCLTLQEDGRLVLYDVDGNPLWKTGRGGDRLDVQDNSHVVLYPAVGNEPIWATGRFFKAGQLMEWIPLRARVRLFEV